MGNFITFVDKKITNMERLISRLVLTGLLLCGMAAWVPALSAVEPSEELTFMMNVNESAFYTFNYPSKSASGEDVVLSSLLIAWQPSEYDYLASEADRIESVHMYSHYTITADNECPTTGSGTDCMMLANLPGRTYRLVGSNKAADYAAHCLIIAPDFEGYGVTKDRPVPYMINDVTAQQVLDATTYGIKLYRQLTEQPGSGAVKMDSQWSSFAIGYSQGGAVSLALHRYIEESGLAGEMNFKGSICGDGPYDLVATMRYYMEDDGDSYGVETDHRAGSTSLAMVLPMIVKGMLEYDPHLADHTLEDYFSRQFLDTGIIGFLDSKEYDTDDIEDMWIKQVKNGLTAGDRHYTAEEMGQLFSYSKTLLSTTVWAKLEKVFTEELYAFLKDPGSFAVEPAYTGNPCDDLLCSLYNHSVARGWTPRRPVLFIHSKYDTVVPYGNLLSFCDEHPEGEGTQYKIVEDSIFAADHTQTGTSFFLSLFLKGFEPYFNYLNDAVTGIGAVASDSELPAGNHWYDLQGRRLQDKPSVRGIYIFNGRKYVIK